MGQSVEIVRGVDIVGTMRGVRYALQEPLDGSTCEDPPAGTPGMGQKEIRNHVVQIIEIVRGRHVGNTRGCNRGNDMLGTAGMVGVLCPRNR